MPAKTVSILSLIEQKTWIRPVWIKNKSPYMYIYICIMVLKCRHSSLEAKIQILLKLWHEIYSSELLTGILSRFFLSPFENKGKIVSLNKRQLKLEWLLCQNTTLIMLLFRFLQRVHFESFSYTKMYRTCHF